MDRIVLLTDGGIESLVTASLILQDLSRTTPVLDRFTLGCQIEHFDDCPEFESSRKSCIEAQANLITSQAQLIVEAFDRINKAREQRATRSVPVRRSSFQRMARTSQAALEGRSPQALFTAATICLAWSTRPS